MTVFIIPSKTSQKVGVWIGRDKIKCKLNLIFYFSVAQERFSQWFYDYRAKTVSENILIFIEK
jgi:hypothetical protein